MRIDILTLFPEMCDAVMSESVIGRARKKGAGSRYFNQEKARKKRLDQGYESV